MKEVEHDQQFSSDDIDEDAGVQEWSTQDFGPPIFITLARIYDLLAVLALEASPKAAGQVLALHEQGLLKGAMPSLHAPVEE
jgi:hypothetical protein